MSKAQLLSLQLATLLTALTGAVYAWMKYFVKGTDEFAVVNHPWQPWMLAAHVVVAPLLLFVLGWTFSNHVLPKYRFGDGQGLITGGAAFVLLVPMTLSGYLLQVATNESLRKAMAVSHWVSAAIFVVAYVAHLFKRPLSS